VIVSYSTTGADEFGQPTTTETETEVQCSFTDKPAVEKWTGYVDIEELVAEIRYVGAMPAKGDRVKLKSRFGRENYEEQRFAEQEYEIIGIRDRDIFGYVCALKWVQV
jgi:hypothetical protein